MWIYLLGQRPLRLIAKFCAFKAIRKSNARDRSRERTSGVLPNEHPGTTQKSGRQGSARERSRSYDFRRRSNGISWGWQLRNLCRCSIVSPPSKSRFAEKAHCRRQGLNPARRTNSRLGQGLVRAGRGTHRGREVLLGLHDKSGRSNQHDDLKTQKKYEPRKKGREVMAGPRRLTTARG